MHIDTTGIIVNCSTCGRANRLSFDNLNRTTRCGQCKNPLAAPDTPIDIPGAQAFDALVSRSAIPVIVDFWAAWCGPCRMVAPELERLARATPGRYVIVKVDTEHQSELAARFRIQSIPTMAVWFGGREIGRTSGARPAADIQKFVDQSVEQHQRRAS
jgi:thioredoxin 2